MVRSGATARFWEPASRTHSPLHGESHLQAPAQRMGLWHGAIVRRMRDMSSTSRAEGALYQRTKLGRINDHDCARLQVLRKAVSRNRGAL